MSDSAATSGPAVIRLATPDDAETIARLVRTAFATVAADIGRDIPPLHETGSAIRERLGAGDVALIAELDGVAVGSVRGELLGEGGVMVRQLVVLPETRRHGIARSLMLALEEQYPDATRFELFTGEMAKGPIALYTSLGYRIVEPRQVVEFPLVWLEKRV